MPSHLTLVACVQTHAYSAGTTAVAHGVCQCTKDGAVTIVGGVASPATHPMCCRVTVAPVTPCSWKAASGIS
jgi:hypothetical protein